MSDALRVAKITFRGQVAGRLEETAAGGTRFIYHGEWRETIACCLPVARREHEWAIGLHPFFQHLGPEGWLREKQARTAHVADEDDFGLLLRYGEDCIGAVGVIPDTDEAQPAVAINEVTNPGRTVSGVQRKLLVARDEATQTFRPASATGLAPYIAKFNSQTLPTLVRNETLCLRWLTAVLGAEEVTVFQRGLVAEINEDALIVTRFDRTQDGQKLRAEDFAQILCKPRGADFSGKYESSYEEAASVISNHSVRPEIDLARFFRRLVAFVAVGNADAHLKNFSLLERPEGLRLSPVYDVVNIGLYEGYDQKFALNIDGKKILINEISRPLLVGLGAQIGLSKATIESTFRDLRNRARQAEQHLPQVQDEGRDPFGVNYTELVRNGCRRLLEE